MSVNSSCGTLNEALDISCCCNFNDIADSLNIHFVIHLIRDVDRSEESAHVLHNFYAFEHRLQALAVTQITRYQFQILMGKLR